MTFSDIFKSSFLESVTEFSPLDTLIGMLFALVIGLFIFVIYKVTFSGIMYSTSFAMSLVGLSLVTTLVIMAVTSNVVLSLGMVGALSIVRFRTAIKEPLDLLFLFWSISTGIICGTGLYKIAIILAVCVTVAIALLKFIPETRTGQLLFVGYSGDLKTDDIKNAASAFGKVVSVKSVNVTQTGTNAVFDVKVSDPDGMIGAIRSLSGVDTVSLTSHDGEFRG